MNKNKKLIRDIDVFDYIAVTIQEHFNSTPHHNALEKSASILKSRIKNIGSNTLGPLTESEIKYLVYSAKKNQFGKIWRLVKKSNKSLIEYKVDVLKKIDTACFLNDILKISGAA